MSASEQRTAPVRRAVGASHGHQASLQDRERASAWVVHGAGMREGWDALGMMLSGLLVFMLPSWWIGRALDQEWILPVGLVLGMAVTVTAVWFRYGVHRPTGGQGHEPPPTVQEPGDRRAADQDSTEDHP